MTEEIIGRCYGETSSMEVSFVSKKTPEIGEYVYLKYNNKIVLGMVDSLLRGNISLKDETYDPDIIERILEIEGTIDHYIQGKVKILGDKEHLEIPRTPAPPGTKIIKASIDLLKEVFSNKNGIEIGHVLTEPQVPIKIDVNKMVSRHLAILAMTGAGKSNTTSVIIDELLKLGGCMVLFDMHSEYNSTKFSNGESHHLDVRINPKDLTITELKQLMKISDGATNQEQYLRIIYKESMAKIKEGDSRKFLEIMNNEINKEIDKLEDEASKKQSHIDAATQVKFKLDSLEYSYGSILSSTDSADIVDSIEPGKINIMPLGSKDENASDIIVKHTLTNILKRRKSYVQGKQKETLNYPIFCIIEEAHILASQTRSTRSSYIIGKIAREGRKFGVGLCLVSQSPKSLNSEALSQVNNLIILRLVEPGDQTHIQKSSESLSQDILKQLPSLNIGEAVILGQMTQIPSMVKINKFQGVSSGNDIDIINEWKTTKENLKKEIEQGKKDLEELGI